MEVVEMGVAGTSKRASKPKAFCLWVLGTDGWKVVAGPAPAGDITAATFALAYAAESAQEPVTVWCGEPDDGPEDA